MAGLGSPLRPCLSYATASCYSGSIRTTKHIWSSTAAVAVALLAGTGCQRGNSRAATAQPEITIAAAANLMEVARVLGSDFEAQTKIHPVFSFGSTAQLATQIENSGPFDVFLAADAEHVDKLVREGLLLPGSDAVYATGVLALWIPPGSKAH
ncbi:MAG: molybdate ABC transporter substrate-binding protein, partial [Terracidiphilus sp.]